MSKKSKLLLSWSIALLLQVPLVQGHSQTKYSFLLKAYTTINDVEWKDSIYWFSKFQEGTILMATGFSPDLSIKINYNLFSEEMEIINNKQDTVSLINAMDVKLLNIGGHVFYNDKKYGYVEVLVPGDISLGISCHLVATMETSSGERFQLTDFNRNSTSRFDRIYQKEYSYFFIDTKTQLYKVSKSALLKLLPSHKEEIKKYLNDNHIFFKNQKDLVALLKFSNSLVIDTVDK